MKIASASIELQSSHIETRQLAVSERLDMWVGDRTRGNAGRNGVDLAGDQVQLSDKARAAQEADPLAAADDAAESDPRLSVLIRMIEFLTGKPVKLMRLDDLSDPSSAAQGTGPSNNASANPRAGFGIAYDYQATYSESEQTEFSATGTVRTADGREISFSLGFSMARSYSETISESFRAGDAVLKDPLVLDFAGPSAALSDLRFSFDLDADGTKEDVPLAGGSGMLAFDRNGNGKIDDGRELFGPTTGDGFAELAALDADRNGWLDENDPAFAQLRLWQPDANGAGQLATLAEAGIGAFHLGRVATPFSLNNAANETLGVMRSSSFYLREDGSAGTVSQIDLSV
ncbi:hypothetical protein CJ010_16310 [Azoarcus sp. DD4]|uniref:hypothetical protein n=1 Tax=Azoarcus sp. DD4 TaxID=2027405 RepID=UPI00112910C4|nr:hypothetical protein [Azoarcus sp. DD4]QDF97981.1 hypothetical protein CJ010_16310 [Azoarcus sp. DD4]